MARKEADTYANYIPTFVRFLLGTTSIASEVQTDGYLESV